MRLPQDVLRCVCFLGIKPDPTKNKIKYSGTGFFVALDRPDLGGAFLFLVTAKHVTDKLIAHSEYYIRVNLRNGTASDMRLPQSTRWYIHPDKSADVVVIPVGLPPDAFDYLAIHPQSTLTEKSIKEKHIGAGDEVFITGLFHFHAGQTRNSPMVRTGHIAMLPGERVMTKGFGLMDACLIESRSIGGLSGSPVFVIVPEKEGTKFYLLGLIHGHWEKDGVEDSISLDDADKAGINVGIAIVTPAWKIFEVMEQNADLKAQIENMAAGIRNLNLQSRKSGAHERT